MFLIAPTAEVVTACMLAIWARISSVALAVWLARLFTSDATTAKPRAASPPRAAWMVALSASRLVCDAITWIRSTTTEMRLALSASPCMVASVEPACATALRAISADVTTCRPISAIEDDSWSVPAETVCTLTVVSSAAEATALTSAFDRSAVIDMRCAVACIEFAESCRLSTAARTGRLEGRDARLDAGGALGLGDAVSVLVGGKRARLEHALAEHLQRIRHRGNLVVLVAVVDFRFEIAIGQKLHRALQVADAAQDVGADIAPDEQRRSDQGGESHRQHDHGCERDFLPRPEGRIRGLLAPALHPLLHADVETDIELAGLLQHGLAVVEGVELLLA